MRLKGTVDLIKGSITLEGELSGLTLSETLRRRVPREARSVVNALALNNGVVDIELKRFRYDPDSRHRRPLTYQAFGPATRRSMGVSQSTVPGQRTLGRYCRRGRYSFDQACPGGQRADDSARRGNDRLWAIP